jgi:hypothetical protein
MAEEKYQPRYEWYRTKLDQNDTPSDLDWTGLDGKMGVGRIRRETSGPTKGKWHWSGSYPATHFGRPPSPNAGYSENARQATKAVEDFYAVCLRTMKLREAPIELRFDYRQFVELAPPDKRTKTDLSKR